uniref:Mitochondrial inner membrane protease subunit 2 n=1 Tax=Setaria italica TaxID=4555 RepID=K3YBX8_SETIT
MADCPFPSIMILTITKATYSYRLVCQIYWIARMSSAIAYLVGEERLTEVQAIRNNEHGMFNMGSSRRERSVKGPKEAQSKSVLELLKEKIKSKGGEVIEHRPLCFVGLDLTCRRCRASQHPTVLLSSQINIPAEINCLFVAKKDFLAFLSRGDVVVFRSPRNHRELVVKRLIALPGGWIQVPEKQEIRQIPQGHCWVEGDNAGLSLDSRTYGPVPLGLMQGRVTHVVRPPNRIGRVDRKIPEGRIMPL